VHRVSEHPDSDAPEAVPVLIVVQIAKVTFDVSDSLDYRDQAARSQNSAA
jgi:hypothetical protein